MHWTCQYKPHVNFISNFNICEDDMIVEGFIYKGEVLGSIHVDLVSWSHI